MIELFAVVGILLAGLILFELLARWAIIPQQVIRKLIHVGMCIIVALICLFVNYKLMITVGVIFTLFFIISRRVYKFRSLRDRHDASWGEIFFPAGIAVAAWIAPSFEVYLASILILAFSDTAAYIVGNMYEKSRVIWADRTIAGSGAGFIVSYIILVSCGFGWLTSLLVAVGVAVAEIFSKNGFDNFSMPVVAALLLWLIPAAGFVR